MRLAYSIVVIVVISVVLTGCAGPQGDYGEELTAEEEVSIEEILRYPAEYEDDTVLIVGIIDDIEDDGKTVYVVDTHSHPLRCLVEGDFSLPESAKTRGIRAQGYAEFDRSIMQPLFHITGCEVF
ncbi:MAG: hypothetical protein GY771_01700 [bacterium]|nr:hypothetical protein [bacterium]